MESYFMNENAIDTLPLEFKDWFSADRKFLCWENLAKTYFIQGENGQNHYLNSIID